MSNRRIKSIMAVANMIELTQDGKMLWKEKNPDDLPILRKDPFEYVDSVFETEYYDKKLRIYRRHYKLEPPERREFWPILIGRKKAVKSQWDSEVILEIVGESGWALWTFPLMNPLSDLLSSVQSKVAGVQDFFDKILAG